MRKITAAGYVTTDFYPDFDNRFYVTGNGVNVIINLLQMRKDVKASVVSAVSDDEYGKAALAKFSEMGIDCSHLEVIPGGETPRVPLYLVNNERTYGTPVRGVMGDYEFSDEAVDFICEHEIMLSDFTGKLMGRLKEIKERGVKIFFDLSTRRDREDVDSVLENCYCCLASFEKGEEDKAHEFLEHAVALGTHIALATFGSDGSMAYDGKNFYRHGIEKAEKVVNTVGAGDSYFSGFISGFLDEKPIEECMAEGAKRSAIIVSVFDPYL